ncbi:hypothetical protein DFH07DRAFT_785134 [Mycena maculata]|uniref:Uncharacterized protein n=1 Tax=Mycena maculata TaxID=230809 RepID=A0AAD7HDE2_9AGAR|nr:hypothetical protein DFH07DRAFT_785134 [Mycena maculata]
MKQLQASGGGCAESRLLAIGSDMSFILGDVTTGVVDACVGQLLGYGEGQLSVGRDLGPSFLNRSRLSHHDTTILCRPASAVSCAASQTVQLAKPRLHSGGGGAAEAKSCHTVGARSVHSLSTLAARGPLLYAEPKEERETSGISRCRGKSGASGRRPEVLLSAVLATPQLRRVPEGMRSDLEEAGGSGQTPLESNTNVTDFVEVVHIPEGTRVTGSGPAGDSKDAWKGTKEAPDKVEGILPRMQMTRGKNNKDKQDPEVSRRLRDEDKIEGRLSP